MRNDLGGTDCTGPKAFHDAPPAAASGEKGGGEQGARAGRIDDLHDTRSGNLGAFALINGNGAVRATSDDKRWHMLGHGRDTVVKISAAGQQAHLVFIAEEDIDGAAFDHAANAFAPIANAQA